MNVVVILGLQIFISIHDGIGYMGMTSFSFDSDFEPPYSHTIFFKRTEDYGETWSVRED